MDQACPVSGITVQVEVRQQALYDKAVGPGCLRVDEVACGSVNHHWYCHMPCWSYVSVQFLQFHWRIEPCLQGLNQLLVRDYKCRESEQCLPAISNFEYSKQK